MIGLDSQLAATLAALDRIAALLAGDRIDLALLGANRIRFREQLAAHFAFKEALYDWMCRTGGHEIEALVQCSRAHMVALVVAYRGHGCVWTDSAILRDPAAYGAAARALLDDARHQIGRDWSLLIPAVERLIAEGATPTDCLADPAR